MTIFRKLGYLAAAAGGLLVPALAWAQNTQTNTTGSNGGTLNLEAIANLFKDLLTIVDMIVPVIFALAFIVFLWGVFTYFIAGGANEEKRKEGAKFVLWAVIGFAVMVSIWGIVRLVTGTFTFDNNNRPCLPTFEGPCK